MNNIDGFEYIEGAGAYFGWIANDMVISLHLILSDTLQMWFWK